MVTDPAALQRLVRQSSFIFTGTVTSKGSSALSVISPHPNLFIARFDRALRVDPMHGDLVGRPITVLSEADREVKVGEQAIFFTTDWVHGQEIAVREIAQLPADEQTERMVDAIVAELPNLHVQERVLSATFIVYGSVTRVERAQEIVEPISEHAANWARARLQIREVVKGEPGRKQLDVYFPTSNDIAYARWPRLSARQVAVFLLHAAPTSRLPQGALIAPDLADFQPEDQLETIRAFLGRQQNQ
jgi:hypothetical protein